MCFLGTCLKCKSASSSPEPSRSRTSTRNHGQVSGYTGPQPLSYGRETGSRPGSSGRETGSRPGSSGRETGSRPGSSGRESRSRHGTSGRASTESYGTGTSGNTLSQRETESSIRSLHSIGSDASRISHGISDAQEFSTRFMVDFETIDEAEYFPCRPWAPDVFAAYQRYKALEAPLAETHRDFLRHLANVRRNHTGDDRLERAELAIKWADAALNVAAARLDIFRRWSNAFPYNTVGDHIIAANDRIQSARNAVDEARRNRAQVYSTFARQTDPAVFR
ncbi:hypothetical protein FQN57_004820 [Myotisia sp. PD_48]|nr:hypothetical protein FQN57_004820 [Myotisia sp. PD_48]